MVPMQRLDPRGAFSPDAFESDPVLACEPEFVYRLSQTAVATSVIGIIIFGLVGIMVVPIQYSREGFENIAELLLAVGFSLVMLAVTAVFIVRLVRRRDRYSWFERDGDKQKSLMSERFSIESDADGAQALARIFTSEQVDSFPNLRINHSNEAICIGLHVYGRHYPLYVSIWKYEGSAVLALPLLRITSQEASDWAARRISPNSDH